MDNSLVCGVADAARQFSHYFDRKGMLRCDRNEHIRQYTDTAMPTAFCATFRMDGAPKTAVYSVARKAAFEHLMANCDHATLRRAGCNRLVHYKVYDSFLDEVLEVATSNLEDFARHLLIDWYSTQVRIHVILKWEDRHGNAHHLRTTTRDLCRALLEEHDIDLDSLRVYAVKGGRHHV